LNPVYIYRQGFFLIRRFKNILQFFVCFRCLKPAENVIGHLQKLIPESRSSQQTCIYSM